MRQLRTAVVAVVGGVVLLACASPGAPPGGPIDITAPQLLAVAPDSGQVNVRPRAVVFRFDEVVSERPTGVPSLGSLFLISPQDGVPVVDWSRSEVSVRPRRGWRPNTVYTVELLPGMTDLRGNISNVGVTTVFSTGPSIPDTRVTGIIFDWAAGTPAARALVQAITPDSIVYQTVADTAGTFALAHLPPGGYVLQGFIDDNRNRAVDPRERFDTLTISLTDSVQVELLTYVRDSVPPRITDVGQVDSVTIRVRVDQPLDPTQEITATQFRVTTLDTVPLPIRSVSAVPPDTVPGPRPSRPIPPRTLTVEVATPLQPDTRYRVWVEDLVNLIGLRGTSERELRTSPTRPPVEETPPADDTTAAPPPPGG